MRRLVILTCLFLYAVASPTQKIEEKKEIENGPDEKSSDPIILDIIEENEETAEGRDMLQAVKKEGRKTIHIHSPNTPNINVMPTKYHITANMPIPPPNAQGFGQGSRGDGLKSGKSDKSKPKNQVNIYVYFPNNTDSMDMEMGEKKNASIHKFDKKESGKETVMMETGKEPVKQVIREDKKPNTSSDTSVPKPSKKPSYVIACPPGHVKILGACVEYDQD